MAVSDPNVNLAPSYQLIQQALQQRAALEAQSGGSNGFGAVNAVAEPVAQQAAVQQARAADLQKQYQNHVMDIVKNNNQLSIPDGASFQDVVSGRVQPVLTPKTHTVTQDDVDSAVKSFSMDDAHKNVFDDLIGKQFTQKDLQAVLAKRANFIHSSEKGNTEPAAFDYVDENTHETIHAQGWYDKDKKQYFLQNGTPAPANITQPDKGGGAANTKQQQFDETNLKSMEKRLDPTQRRAGTMADAQKRTNGIQRLQALFDGYQNDLTPQEWQEASIAWASVLGSGTGVNSREQIESLVPKSLRGNVKGEMQWVMNNPTGTDQQAFAERIKTGMAREMGVNQGIVKDSQIKGLSGFQDVIQRNPSEAKAMLENYNISPEDFQKAYPKLAKTLYPELTPAKDVATPADALKLAPGTKFRLPDGRTGIVK